MRFHTSSHVLSAALRKRCLSFAKTCSIGLLDRIEIGAIEPAPAKAGGRQEDELGPGGADGVSHGFAFMAAKVVEDHDVARFQSGDQNMIDIGLESLAIDGAVEHAGRIDAVAA